MAIGPAVVERWLELSTQELRVQIKQLVAARLPGDHAVWQAVRRHPALVARIRSILSGLTAEAGGSKDEAMQKVWITTARTALDQQQPAPEKKAPKLAAKKPVVKEMPEEEPVPVLVEPPKPTNGAPRPVIPAMVFQEPS
ncbi:hypothetical protein FKR81_38825 [Lentzea tibetensis]|uniref:Uncharacterized protein n=1 Tax=Lentzea tibetensis TaxID=2591470 RepID=A0A563EHF5_9PSEU|nr:hypothetical protein [Lentzea tibetensis]TWP45604.1 hypothetical protein FKR81_38825 [Lentzea tibetensis]